MMPAWAIDDMQDLSLSVDPLLSPASFLQSNPQAFYAPVHWLEAGKAYQRIAKALGSRKFDTVLLVPWLKRGGADLGALHHAKLCQGEFGHRTLVIATEVGDSPWAGRLPHDTCFLDIGEELHSLNEPMNEAEIILARLLIQLAPQRIHIINSHTAWKTLERHGQALRQQSRLYASLYCDELTPDGRADGLAQRYLPTASQWLDAIITDNSAAPDLWRRMLGIRRELFKVVHFPAPCISVPTNKGTLRRRVLWASRLERQKRPDLLVEIATQIHDIHWDIYGSPLSAQDPHLAALSKLSNVTLHGSFERFQDIVSDEHLAYVYTTAWDGLPNVLLEAAKAGLPIVAPDIGGIHDLVSEKWLLPPTATPVDYISDIKQLTDIEIRNQRLSDQNARIETFTWKAFADGMRKIEGYAHIG